MADVDPSTDHRLSGTVQVEGRGPGDRWRLHAGTGGFVVKRTEMPCASCWAETLLMVHPTVAYQFIHPVHDANLLDGHFPAFDHEAMKAECLSRVWKPVSATARPVVWPRGGGFYEGWWIDLDAFPDAVPFTWGRGLDELGADADVIDLWTFRCQIRTSP